MYELALLPVLMFAYDAPAISKDRVGATTTQVTPTIRLQMLGDPDKEMAGRVMQAMYAIKKIIIADLGRLLRLRECTRKAA